VKIALTEALNNAVKHGNKGDYRKTVFISYSLSSSFIEFLVHDQGEGFDYHAPELNDSLLLASYGRGLLVIAQKSAIQWTALF
jgi:serine/threonine-protein kinase RsbW